MPAVRARGATRARINAKPYHWFDGERARAEFRRILRPGGTVTVAHDTRVFYGPIGGG